MRVRGVVQGVGFRPFVYRLARANQLAGWVLNAENGVEIHLEGAADSLQRFVHDLPVKAPSAAQIMEIETETSSDEGFDTFLIRESENREQPTVCISPDLPVCEDCLSELLDPTDPRYHYPYINCTNCGPRYSVILNLPYDRPETTMQAWKMDHFCQNEYDDPGNRRFHAQPVACGVCGPHLVLNEKGGRLCGDESVLRRAVTLLREASIVAIKGLGGYHLACNALDENAVLALRERKFRKEKPFAILARNLEVAKTLIELSPSAQELLTSVARPIVLAPARVMLEAVAPETNELGVMLPYTPLHYLLFEAGAPEALVMTSGNRSSEPIAYKDEDALASLADIADAILVGERPIARRVDDSVVRDGVFGPQVLRRSRGYAPGAVARLPVSRPLLAVGADLKNAITLVVDGQAFVSQHVGDLDHYPSLCAFQETISDLISMYRVRWEDLLLVHDAHPQYRSTLYGLELPAAEKTAVQHHRAHIASVLAEHGAWETPVVGVSLDGTGYGDDGSIWGGEFFAGSVIEGFQRVAHLRPAALPGGDAAAQHPVQAAAGFLAQIEGLPDLTAFPFHFPSRYEDALELVHKEVRTFPTTSAGRLFDCAAALLGFTRGTTFEGQAAMWLEALATQASCSEAYPFPFENGELDFRPLLYAVAINRARGRDARQIARAFQRGVARGLAEAIETLAAQSHVNTVVLSGGVFQNELLLRDMKLLLTNTSLTIWTNRSVPTNDGGISLGQAALGGLQRASSSVKESAGLVSDTAVRYA